MMAEILLTHSYFLTFDPKEQKAMMPYAPLGTLYALAALRKAGYSCALFDAMLAGSEEEIVPAIDRHAPRLVVIYDDDFNYLTKMCLGRMREAAFRMSRLAYERGCTVIVHGSDPADHIAAYLANGARFVIAGEGEHTLIELIGHLLSGTPSSLDRIAGIAYEANGILARTPPRALLHDLDVIPFPAWDTVDVERYRSLWRRHHGYFSMNMVTTRGCPFHCNWCAKPIYGQVYHSRSPENVADEMLLMKKTYAPDHLWFCDDIFGLKPGWVPRFADVVIEREAQIPFKCLSRADLLLKEETIGHLRRAGCHTVWIGAESGSQKVLDAMEKGTTVEQIYTVTAQMHRAGIRVGFFLQYGYPGEQRSDIEKTLHMVKECKPEEIGISVSYPLPGTRFYENIKSRMGEKHNWVDSQDLELMYPGEYQPDFYRALHRLTHKKFRLWQGVDILKSSLLRPWTVDKTKLRRMAAGAFHALTLPALQARMEALAKPNVTSLSTK